MTQESALPHEWSWVPLSDVITSIKTGTTPPSKVERYYGGDIKWFTPGDIGGTKHLISSNRTITNAAKIEGKARIFEENTLLITCIGNIGRAGILAEQGSANQQITGVMINESICRTEYVYWWFRCNQPQIQGMASQAVIPILNQSNLKRVSIPLPFPENLNKSLKVQKQIVARIEALLAEVREMRQLHEDITADLDQLGIAILTDTLKELRATSKSRTINELLADKHLKITGGGTPRRSKSEFWSGNIPWVSPKDMKTWLIEDATEHINSLAIENSSTKRISAGSVLVVVRGMILAHTWPVAVTSQEVAINQDMKAIIPNGRIKSKYLGYILRASAPEVLRKVETAAHGTKRLKTSTLKDVPIPIVDTQVQEKIISRLNRFFLELEQMQRAHAEAEQSINDLERSILAQAFRGEL